MHRRLAPLVLAAGLLLLLWASHGLARPAAPPTPPRESQTVVIGEEFLAAEVWAASGTPVVSREQAIAVAHKYVSGWPQASDTSARYAMLILHPEGGNTAASGPARRVWLVTFRGVPYDPAGTCGCAEYFRRSTTGVALDAADGELVAVYGTNL
jgi:hypothetical protein